MKLLYVELGNLISFLCLIETETSTWRIHAVPADVHIGYAHASSTSDDHLIYFHGGLLIEPTSSSDTSVTNWLSNAVYAFNSSSFAWRMLDSSTSSAPHLYMHSLDLLLHDSSNNTLLVVFGGYAANESSATISDRLGIFETRSAKWSAGHASRLRHRQRYGHCTFVERSNTSASYLYVFAGFNGFFLGDTFRIDVSRLLRKSNKTRRSSSSSSKTQLRQFFATSSDDYADALEDNNNHTVDAMDSFGNKLPIRPLGLYAHYVQLLSLDDQTQSNNNNKMPSDSLDVACGYHVECERCQARADCEWSSLANECVDALSAPVDANDEKRRRTCSVHCATRTSCASCVTLTHEHCAWCASSGQCWPRAATRVLYPFGVECMSYTLDARQCSTTTTTTTTTPATATDARDDADGLIVLESDDESESEQATSQTNQPDEPRWHDECALRYSNCSACVRDERCGWCTSDTLLVSSADADTFVTLSSNETSTTTSMMTKRKAAAARLNTGHGVCMEGGESMASSAALAPCRLNWHFTVCPDCECNGHSKCDSSTLTAATHQKPTTNSVCSNCLNNTAGAYCDECAPGFYGEARNNGSCRRCECGSQALECDAHTGRCHCHTKGVVGARCDQCDYPRYSGRPAAPHGSCFYNLTIDYQFTFNLNKETDRHYTHINFVSHPTLRHADAAAAADDDIDFMIRCYRHTALVDVSYVPRYDKDALDKLLAAADDDDSSLPPHSPIVINYRETRDLQDQDEAEEAEDDSDTQIDDRADQQQHNRWPLSFSLIFSKMWLLGASIGSSSNNKNTSNWARRRSSSSSSNQATTNNTAARNIYSSPLFANMNDYQYYFGDTNQRQLLLDSINCTSSEYKYTFSSQELAFAMASVDAAMGATPPPLPKNPVFVVHVRHFRTPVTIQIAFSRRSKVQLVHFFVTFFGCLLSLLTIAFITWKSKQRYDRFRRQRDIVIQMEHMAKRPFAKFLLEVTSNNNNNNNSTSTHHIVNRNGDDGDVVKVAQSAQQAELEQSMAMTTSTTTKKSKFSTNFMCKSTKKRSAPSLSSDAPTRTLDNQPVNSNEARIMPLAVEPLVNNKTAVLTCLLRLPQGHLTHTPRNTSPFVLASAYVQLNATSPFVNLACNATASSRKSEPYGRSLTTRQATAPLPHLPHHPPPPPPHVPPPHSQEEAQFANSGQYVDDDQDDDDVYECRQEDDDKDDEENEDDAVDDDDDDLDDSDSSDTDTDKAN